MQQVDARQGAEGGDTGLTRISHRPQRWKQREDRQQRHSGSPSPAVIAANHDCESQRRAQGDGDRPHKRGGSGHDASEHRPPERGR
jgi:hypothetical protein